MITRIEQLIQAIKNGDCITVERLLRLGVDPNNYLDAARITPLHFAAQKGIIAIAELLLNYGAKLDVFTEPDHQSPYNVAIVNKQYAMALFLEKVTGDTYH